MTARSCAATAILIATSFFTPIYGVAGAQTPTTTQKAAQGVLSREQAAAILPPSVFFRGQSASIQGRNSSGIRLANGKLLLAALVDTSGYSSTLQQTYQAYLIAETSLTIGGQRLSPGAYGFGFVADNKMVLMDIGGNEILHATTTHDQALPRPTPLQILPGTATGTFRLYLGRNYVTLAPAEK